MILCHWVSEEMQVEIFFSWHTSRIYWYLVKVCWLVTIWKNDLIQNRMFLVRYSLHLLLVVWLNDICCQWWLSGFLIQSKMIFSISSQQHRHHGHWTGTRQIQAANDNKTQSVPVGTQTVHKSANPSEYLPSYKTYIAVFCCICDNIGDLTPCHVLLFLSNKWKMFYCGVWSSSLFM